MCELGRGRTHLRKSSTVVQWEMSEKQFPEKSETAGDCLVHIFQANDLVCLMAYPKVGFFSLQRVLNFCLHSFPTSAPLGPKLGKNTNLRLRNGPFFHPAVY